MIIYRGMFGTLYTINSNGIVCYRKPDGGNWYASNYSVDGFKDAIDKGYVTEVSDERK